MQATLYLISQAYLSGVQQRRLRAALLERTDGLADLVRLERDGASLWSMLDTLALQGARDITLRPLGLPSAESLLRWLPGAVGEWLSRQGPCAPTVWMTDDLSHLDAVLDGITEAKVTRRPITPVENGANGKGWDAPPTHRHHILVCTGPRCHLRDAPDLLGIVKAEIARAGLSRACLVAATGCLFPCNAGPVVIHYPKGHWYRLPDKPSVRAFVETALVADRPLTQYQTFQTGVPDHVP